MRDALAEYSAVANLSFQEVADATNVQLRFFRDDLTAVGQGNAGGYAYYPPSGDVHINSLFADDDLQSPLAHILLHDRPCTGHAASF